MTEKTQEKSFELAWTSKNPLRKNPDADLIDNQQREIKRLLRESQSLRFEIARLNQMLDRAEMLVAELTAKPWWKVW